METRDGEPRGEPRKVWMHGGLVGGSLLSEGLYVLLVCIGEETLGHALH